jgi:DUF1009 family protein
MSVTLEQFIEATGAEIVGGNVVVGVTAERKIVGSVIDGPFNLNDVGLAMSAEIDAGATKVSANRKKVAVEAAAVEVPTFTADAPADK